MRLTLALYAAGWENIPGYVMGTSGASWSPNAVRMGGIVTRARGPKAATAQDQKYAGLSREDQRRYRNGVDQKWGIAPDMVGRWFVVMRLRVRYF
jgi:hypothetical protein